MLAVKSFLAAARHFLSLFTVWVWMSTAVTYSRYIATHAIATSLQCSCSSCCCTQSLLPSFISVAASASRRLSMATSQLLCCALCRHLLTAYRPTLDLCALWRYRDVALRSLVDEARLEMAKAFSPYISATLTACPAQQLDSADQVCESGKYEYFWGITGRLNWSLKPRIDMP